MKTTKVPVITNPNTQYLMDTAGICHLTVLGKWHVQIVSIHRVVRYQRSANRITRTATFLNVGGWHEHTTTHYSI